MTKMKRQLTVAAALVLVCGTAKAGAPQPFSPQLFLDWDDVRQLLSQQ